MSWFGQIVGGLAEGAGKGGAAEAEYRDKLDAQRELQAERLLERRESQQARLDQQRELALMRAESAKGNRRGSGGGGGSFFDDIQDIKTPEQAQRYVASVNATDGPNAAAQAAEALGLKMEQTVSPTTGDFARYDRSLNELGQSDEPAPQSSTQTVQWNREQGQIGLQRFIARASGKYKDHSEGEAIAYGTDVVRGAGTDPGKLGVAAAVNMALKGDDMVGVSGGTQFNKAGIVPSTTTEVGRSMINENNAQAGNAGASAAQHRASVDKIRDEIANPKSKGATTERLFSQLNSVNATLLGYDADPRKRTGATPEQKKAYADEVAKAQKLRTTILSLMDGRLEGDTPKTDPNPAPAAPQPRSGAPAASTDRKVGQTQIVQSGPNKGKTAVFDGKGWKLQ